jgi:hypothetical protein
MNKIVHWVLALLYLGVTAFLLTRCGSGCFDF